MFSLFAVIQDTEQQSVPTQTRTPTLDEAIAECDSHIRQHRFYSWMILALLIPTGFAFYRAFEAADAAMSKALSFVGNEMPPPQGQVEQVARLASRLASLPYIYTGAFIVIFGVLVALYRFHLLEITKNEQYKLGFWRIRIAANNTSEGFQTEVRRALTDKAFSFEKARPAYKGLKELESPLPGHPAFDLVTAVLNKLLDEVEFKPSKKKLGGD